MLATRCSRSVSVMTRSHSARGWPKSSSSACSATGRTTRIKRQEAGRSLTATSRFPSPTRHTYVHVHRARSGDSWPRRLRPPAARPDFGFGRRRQVPRALRRGAGQAGRAAQAASADRLAQRRQGQPAAQADVLAQAGERAVAPSAAEGGRRAYLAPTGAWGTPRKAALDREDGRDTRRLRRLADRPAPAGPRPPVTRADSAGQSHLPGDHGDLTPASPEMAGCDPIGAWNGLITRCGSSPRPAG